MEKIWGWVMFGLGICATIADAFDKIIAAITKPFKRK